MVYIVPMKQKHDKGEEKLLINSAFIELKTKILLTESIISRLDITENLISDLQDNTEKEVRNPEEKGKESLLTEKMREMASQLEIQLV